MTFRSPLSIALLAGASLLPSFVFAQASAPLPVLPGAAAPRRTARPARSCGRHRGRARRPKSATAPRRAAI